MEDTFYFIDYDIQEIQKKKFICVYVLDFEKRVIFRIFKVFNDKLYEYLQDNFTAFQEFNSHLDFVIKRDGKIALDIKI